jgi:hypothetical protein
MYTLLTGKSRCTHLGHWVNMYTLWTGGGSRYTHLGNWVYKYTIWTGSVSTQLVYKYTPWTGGSISTLTGQKGP